MGIPSYYRQLISSVAGLVEKLNQYNSLRWCNHLWIDFNCIIYHCIHRPGMPKPEECGSLLEYEDKLINEVITYLDYIIDIARPKETVYIAVDGVVPAAKRRQQRMRRWITEPSAWNKNVITPGTEFMGKLQEKLERFICMKEAKSGNTLLWHLSGANEPGEGEHKIMKQLRYLPPNDYKTHFIYGLDADLILLSILHCAVYHPTESFFLYREEMDNNEVVYNENNKESLIVFSIELLMKYIANRRATVLDMKDTWVAWMIDYVFIMSLLGNDFMPSYITASFKDDGHSLIMRLLMGLWDKGLRLVTNAPVAPKYDSTAWIWIFNRLEGVDGGDTDEDRYIKLFNKKKIMIEKRRNGMCNLVEDAVMNVNGELLPDWKDRVYMQFSGIRGSARQVGRALNKMHREALEWVLAYYFGDEVDTDWYYSAWITPFAEDAKKEWLVTTNYLKNKTINQYPSEAQQLALVLPERDMNLIGIPGLRGFSNSVWFDMPVETKWCEFMKWAEWERYPKIACPLLADFVEWNKC
jgi:5'-3' exonuclease